MEIYKEKFFNLWFLRIGVYRFSIEIKKWYIRFYLVKVVHKKPVWAFQIPFGFVYQIPVNKFARDKEFQVLFPFTLKQIFQRT